jgi:DNA-binding response OmpR family regulator
VVDDEAVIRRVAQLSLAGAGFQVVEAGDSSAALAAIRAAPSPFELVMLDLTLPDGEGNKVIPEIRRLAPAARILVVSGLGQMDAAALGADAYLAKPFTKTTLLSATERALAGSGAVAKAPSQS